MIPHTFKVDGIVYAAEPIYNPEAYAHAVFGDRRDEVLIKAEGDTLMFNVRKPQIVDENTTLLSLVDGLITGDDRNVKWIISTY